VLVFQYGSNCLESEINGEDRLRGDARFVDIAKAADYELAFDVVNKNRGCAASDIVAKVGSTVWGVLYQIPDWLIDRSVAEAKGRRALDAIEGAGGNYEQRRIRVRRPNSRIEEAITYTVRRPMPGLKTGIDYVDLIVAGLREHNIDEKYIATVKAIASENNPEIAEDIRNL
jgi:hypothetical protein